MSVLVAVVLTRTSLVDVSALDAGCKLRDAGVVER